jgi:glucose/arabinose dehydrogenase
MKLNRKAPLLLLVAASVAACADPAPTAAQTGEAVNSEHHSFRVTTVAEGLNNPWGIAFLPGGDILITERPGRLRIVREGALLAAPVGGVPTVWARGQGGLLDVVPHPAFASNRLIYLSYSKPNADGDEATTAVVRGRFDGANLTDVEEIFEAKAWGRGGNHFGSRLAFDRDGYLFITVGDRGASPMIEDRTQHPSQDPTNHQGTVLRLHDDGRVPSDNPYVGHATYLPEIWSWGHRNPQGLAIDPVTNQVWSSEHGPQGGDELNLVLPGKNYGWPVVGLGVQYGGAQIHDAAQGPGMEDPVHAWVPSIATSGHMIYSGDAFPQWKGNTFIGGLAGEQIARLVIENGRVVSEETLLRGSVGRIRDIRQSLEGFIYLAIDDRRGGETAIVRLVPVSGN